MSQSAAPNSHGDADRLEAATDQAIEACGGDVRAALKAMIVANEFLEFGSLRIDAGRFASLCARKIQNL